MLPMAVQGIVSIADGIATVQLAPATIPSRAADAPEPGNPAVQQHLGGTKPPTPDDVIQAKNSGQVVIDASRDPMTRQGIQVLVRNVQVLMKLQTGHNGQWSDAAGARLIKMLARPKRAANPQANRGALEDGNPVNAIGNDDVPNIEPMNILEKKKKGDNGAKNNKDKEKTNAMDIDKDANDDNIPMMEDPLNGDKDGAGKRKMKKANKNKATDNNQEKTDKDDAVKDDNNSMKADSSSDSSSSSTDSTSSATSAKSSGKVKAKASAPPKPSPKSSPKKASRKRPTMEDYTMLSEELDSLRELAETAEKDLERANGRIDQLTIDIQEYEVENEYLRRKLRVLGGELSE